MHRSPLDKPPTTMMVPFAFQVACFAQLPTGKAHRQPRDTALDGFTPDAYLEHRVIVAQVHRALEPAQVRVEQSITLVHDDLHAAAVGVRLE